MFKRGFVLWEVVVGTAILAAFALGLTAAFQSALKLNNLNLHFTQANFLLAEGVEAVRLMRDNGWDANIGALSVDTDYFLTYNTANNLWQSTAANVFLDGLFERKFRLSAVYRDGSQNISPTGTLDANSKKLDLTVSWRQGAATTTRTISTYLTDLFVN